MNAGLGLTRTLIANMMAHGSRYNAVTREQAFMASMQAGAALGTALTATAVTFTLYNPTASQVRVVLQSVRIGITTAPVGAGSPIYVLAINNNIAAAVPATVSNLTIVPSLLGGTKASKVKAYSAATLPAVPTIARVVGGSYWATAAGAASVNINDDVDGAIILLPNTAVTLQAIGVATSGAVSMMWEEVPYAL